MKKETKAVVDDLYKKLKSISPDPEDNSSVAFHEKGRVLEIIPDPETTKAKQDGDLGNFDENVHSIFIQLDHISAITKVDERTVRITTQGAQGTFKLNNQSVRLILMIFKETTRQENQPVNLELSVRRR